MTLPPPSQFNPIVLHRLPSGNHLDMYMLPAGGGPYGDWQRIRLLQQGPHANGGPESIVWDINGASAMVAGIEHKLLDLTAAPLTDPTTHSMAGQFSHTADIADVVWCGPGHGYIRRTRPAIAFANGGAPEFFGSVTPGSVVPVNSFYIDQDFEIMLGDGSVGGEWKVFFLLQQQSGRWVMRVKQFLKPRLGAPVYIRTLYSLMLAATNITHAQAGNNLPLDVTVNSGQQRGNGPGSATDFGPDPRVWRFWNTAHPQVQWRASASQVSNGDTVMASFTDRQNGNSHLSDQVDGLDKIRAAAISYVTPQLWTQPIEITNDYTVGLF